MSLLPEISKNCSDRSLHNEDGTVPEMELLYRESVASLGAPNSSGSGPYKLFLLRSKSVRLIGSLGIGPLNWLELRSIADALISSNLGDREPLI